jgi:hypothetical protein
LLSPRHQIPFNTRNKGSKCDVYCSPLHKQPFNSTNEGRSNFIQQTRPEAIQLNRRGFRMQSMMWRATLPGLSPYQHGADGPCVRTLVEGPGRRYSNHHRMPLEASQDAVLHLQSEDSKPVSTAVAGNMCQAPPHGTAGCGMSGRTAPPAATSSAQGLTLVHFPAQLEPCLPQEITLHTLVHPLMLT